MSFQAMTVAAAINLPASQKSLLFCIANYVNEQNKFWPSYQTLANDSGMCRRSVINHMNKFVEMGLVDKEIQICDKGQKSNLYTFKGVQYLKNKDYKIELSDAGFIQISPPETNETRGCKSFTGGVQTFHGGGANAAPKSIKEPIKEIKDIGEKPKRFVPPILNDVFQYFSEKGLADRNLAENFIDHYTSNGWMVGKNKMKDWKAAVRTWVRNNNQPQASDIKKQAGDEQARKLFGIK